MITPRLINILKSFSPDEIKSFKKFLLSPFFNTNKTYTKFYKELAKFYPDFKSDSLNSEYIFRRLFGGKPFHKQTMWNLSSGLEKLAEEYLTHSAVAKQPFDKFKLILRELEIKKLDKLYLKKLLEMEKFIQKARDDSDYFSELGELAESRITYWQKVKGVQDHFSEDIIEITEIYTLTYLTNIYRILGDLEYYKVRTNISHQFDAAVEFFSSIDFNSLIVVSKKNKYKFANLIEFYCNVILSLLNNNNEEYYYKVQKFLFKNHELFNRYEKKNLIAQIASYCVFKILQGNPKFPKELFNINKFRIKQNIATYENGRIGKAVYIQIVSNAASLKEIQWVEEFIEKYTPMLFEDHQDSMRNLARAYVNFYTKKYSEVLISLNKFQFTDIIDKIHVKNLIARTYYEMKEFEMLLYHIDSTKHFLNNNKYISSYLSEVNGKYFDYLHSIVTAIEKNDAKKLVKLEENLKKESAVNNKIWLLEKIAEISNQKI